MPFELKQIISGIIIGLILGIGGTLILQGQKIVRLEAQIEVLKEKSNNIAPTNIKNPIKIKDPINPIIIEIIYPRDRDSVSREIHVEGRYENVPDDLDIWVYVYAPGAQLYFPQNIVTPFGDNTWQANAIVGSTDKSDIGAAFKIGVLTVNKTTSSKLIGKRFGLRTLPAGTNIRDRVTVYRSEE